MCVSHRRPLRAGAVFMAAGVLAMLSPPCVSQNHEASTWRHFEVVEDDGEVVATRPIRCEAPPRWARDVEQTPSDWQAAAPPDVPERGLFRPPIPFVVPPPPDSDEPFHRHNHQPAITWCENGDLLAIWYSTKGERDTLLTVLASRLRAGADAWDPASEFFKAAGRNMHGSSVFHDGDGTLYHFNGMGPAGGRGWSRLALLLRTSTDNGVSWTPARPISTGAVYQRRHQVIAGTSRTPGGVLIQPCDATPGGQGPTAIHVSDDGGQTWHDPGGDIRGIHAGVVGLGDGRLLACGRARALQGRMPLSRSDDLGAHWTHEPSPFPPIRSGQRLVLLRLAEGPLLLVSFADDGLEFTDRDGDAFTGHGMFAALSDDDGASWPTRKLLTPGSGTHDGGAHTGKFTATPTRVEPAGYLAATQTPDGVIHLISSRLHYRFDLAWLQVPNAGA